MYTTVSRQLADILTNPDGEDGTPAWTNTRDGDIADTCVNGGFVKLADGNKYWVSEMYSNKAGKCVLPNGN